jgi:hypothetical protein
MENNQSTHYSGAAAMLTGELTPHSGQCTVDHTAAEVIDRQMDFVVAGVAAQRIDVARRGWLLIKCARKYAQGRNESV